MNAFIVAEKILSLVGIGLQVDALIQEIQEYKRSVNGDDDKLSEFIDSLLDREIGATQHIINQAKGARGKE